MDWFKIGKGIAQDYIFSLCSFNFDVSKSYEMPGWMNHKLESRLPNITNLRHTDDTTIMTESKEELKRLLLKVKQESEKAG